MACSVFSSQAAANDTRKIFDGTEIDGIDYFRFIKVPTVFLAQSLSTPEIQVEEEPKKPKKIIKNLEYFLLAGFFVVIGVLYFFLRKKKYQRNH